MSYSFSRDRTAELRGSPNNNNAGNGTNISSGDDEFGPARRPLGSPAAVRQQSGNQQYFQQSAEVPPQQQPHDWGYTPPPPRPERSSEREAYEMSKLQQLQHNEPDITTISGFFDQIDKVKSDIDAINYNIDQIGNLHNTALASFNEQQSKQTARDLDKIKLGTQAKNIAIKTRIQELENANIRLPNNSDTQMRRSQTAALRKRFMETIQRYQDVERNYQLKYRQRIERQIRIVKPDASQDEVDDIIDSDSSPQVFAQSLMTAGRQSQSKAVLSEVQTRHMDIKEIERTIVELHQLFMDMQMMVEQQGEVLNTVEQNANDTVVHMKAGNTSLTRAIALAKSTRAKKWCCFFLCIGICIMIAILVWWFAFGHVGANTGGSSSGSGTNTQTAAAAVAGDGGISTQTTTATVTAIATATTAAAPIVTTPESMIITTASVTITEGVTSSNTDAFSTL